MIHTILFDGDALYEGRFDINKVEIVGWEYSATGGDGPHFTNIPITFKVTWMRPVFGKPANFKPIKDGKS